MAHPRGLAAEGRRARPRDMRRAGPRGGPGHHSLNPGKVRVDIVSTPPDAAAVLELSAERDLWLRRLVATGREEYQRGRREGVTEGRELEAAEREAAWRRNSAALVAAVFPDSRQARESAQRRIRAAEAGCRRDASEQWHGFHERARATPPGKRNEVQRAALALTRPARAGAA